MATLKEHQAVMVDLLANGSCIPASASRLAHAMHDVLATIDAELTEYRKRVNMADAMVRAHADRIDATTPGLNDKALSKREKALKTDSPAKWPTPAEQRVKELENTIKQLRASNAKLKSEAAHLREANDALREYRDVLLNEQSGCRKEDTQVCDHDFRLVLWCSDLQQCSKCGATKQ